MNTHMLQQRLVITLADETHREEIYRMRHAVYAAELAQHPENSDEELHDTLDASNIYIVALWGSRVVGFISITPPQTRSFSIDKYVDRKEIPFEFNDSLWEVRILTVEKEYRSRNIFFALMYAAFRWVEAHGGEKIIAIGRDEVLGIYMKAGLQPLGITIHSGAVTFQVITATIEGLRDRLDRFDPLLRRLESNIMWELDIPFLAPAPCFHGGSFFTAIGDGFDKLERREGIINADVLDAWFPPSPKVLDALQEHLSWLIRTSPPTTCNGMRSAIAAARGVGASSILPGAGSSDLIYLAFREWLTPSSRVLILEPTYGEYPHILEKVIGCSVDRLELRSEEEYRIDLPAAAKSFGDGYDLVVVVNPNSPTGSYIDRHEMEELLCCIPPTTRVWIDETYIDYIGEDTSLERFASRSRNIVICKSMSKVYALSGLRAAYLCASPHLLEQLRSITPPWSVSLPAQVAAVAAVGDPLYYRERYRQTHILRHELAAALNEIGIGTYPGSANFLLCTLPREGPGAETLIKRCNASGLYLRNAGTIGSQIERHLIRIAVKDRATNERMVQLIEHALDSQHTLHSAVKA